MSPDVMAKVEYLVTVSVGLRHVKVVADKGYQNGVENKIEKFGKYLVSLFRVGLA